MGGGGRRGTTNRATNGRRRQSVEGVVENGGACEVGWQWRED